MPTITQPREQPFNPYEGISEPHSYDLIDRASAFEAPSGVTPEDLFDHQPEENILEAHGKLRYRRFGKPCEILIYTDGSCLDQNSKVNTAIRKAGCAWVYKPVGGPGPRSVSMRLEEKGPTGQKHPQTSNRAELRAALGALTYRPWCNEFCHSLVIATDSEYLVKGITLHVPVWKRNGWRKSNGAPVKNVDLWQALLLRINELASHGLDEILFWRIPREWNREADAAANTAAHGLAIARFRTFHPWPLAKGDGHEVDKSEVEEEEDEPMAGSIVVHSGFVSIGPANF